MSFKAGTAPAKYLVLLAIVIKMFVGKASASVILAQLSSVTLVCGIIGLISATVSFFAALGFVRYLYGSMGNQKNE